LRGIALVEVVRRGEVRRRGGRGNAGRQGELRRRKEEEAFMAEGEAPPTRLHGGAGVAAWPSGAARRLGNPQRNESEDQRRSRRHKIG
jgi:ribosomal protein L15